MLINISRELCIGAAPCVAIAGNVFQLDDEGKAILVGPSEDDATTQLAAEACPVRAIFLYSNDKTQVYPDPAESPRAFESEPNSGESVPDVKAMPQVIENPPADKMPSNDNPTPEAGAKAA